MIDHRSAEEIAFERERKIRKENLEEEERREWRKEAKRQHEFLVTAIFGFALLVLLVISYSLYFKYKLEITRLNQHSTSDNRSYSGTEFRGTGSPANVPLSETPSDNLSSEKSLAFIERFVATESQARKDEGKSPDIPLSALKSIIDALVGSGSLTSEAVKAVNDVRSDLVKAGIDVSTDTIKKITSKLLGSRRDDKPTEKTRGAADLQNNFNINLSCSAERPVAASPAARPKTHHSVPSKVMCPVPLVPVKPG